MKPYYKDDGCIIYNCDAYDVVAELTYDCIITDPPYSMNVGGGAGLAAHRQYLKDIRGFTDGGFDMSILDSAKNWMCFCSKDQLIELLQKAEATGNRWMLLTWNKQNPTPLVNNTYLPEPSTLFIASPRDVYTAGMPTRLGTSCTPLGRT